MVNNAGIPNIKPIPEVSEDEWQEVIDVNLTGIFFVAQAAGNRIVEKRTAGQIINIPSIFGDIGVQGRGPYNASKGCS